MGDDDNKNHIALLEYMTANTAAGFLVSVRQNVRAHAPVYALWLGVALLSLALQTAGWETHWRYDREQVANGAWWLYFTGHIVHLNWSHWLLNMAGLGIVAFFFTPYAPLWQWLLVLLVSAVCISAGVALWHPEIRYYVGLSGVLHGLFVFGALREIRHYPLSGYVLTAILFAKLGWEFFQGALPGSEAFTGGRVLTDAHLYGAVGGLLVWLLLVAFNKVRA